MILICGPCVIETFEKLKADVEAILDAIGNQNIDLYFKSSCIKDNRSNLKNFYGPGFDIGLSYLKKIREIYNIKITTDFHTVEQIEKYGNIVDLIQIPAFLSMQTGLVTAAAKTGNNIHIKKAQWLPPYDVHKPINKILNFNNSKIFITDRGTTFGYGNVVFDPRHIRLMKDNSKCYAVLADITHLQNHSEIYDRTYAKDVGLAALAAGADGIFMEATTNPEDARCDSDAMIPTSDLDMYIKSFLAIYNTRKIFFITEHAEQERERQFQKISNSIKTITEKEVYDPIFVNGILLKDGLRRKAKNQYKRIDPIANNIEEGGTFLDLGCNTGYMLRKLVKRKKLKAVGVDYVHDLILLCKLIFDYDDLYAKFVNMDLFEYVESCIEKRLTFDYVSMTSVFDFDSIIKMLDSLLSITDKKVFLEPTNHEKMSYDDMIKRFEESPLSKYNTKIIATTDYQDRLLYMVEK